MSGCAYFEHHNDVRPKSDGVHKVVINTEDQQSGYREAKSQADHYCKSLNKSPFIINEEYKYVGEFTENNYNMLKTAAKVVQSAGAATWFLGNEEHTQKAAMATAVGGEIADEAIGAGYYYTIEFRCQ